MRSYKTLQKLTLHNKNTVMFCILENDVLNGKQYKVLSK